MPTNNLFLMNFPEGWKETTVYTFEGPNDGGVQHNLAIVIHPKTEEEYDLNGFVKSEIENGLSALPGFELISEQNTAIADGTPGYQVIYKYAPSDEKEIYQKQLFINAKKAIIIAASTFSKKTLQTLAMEADSILSTIRLVDSEKVNRFLEQYR